MAQESSQPANLPPRPDTPRRPVEDSYHGVKVVDEYRWLEDHGSPEVKKWVEAQNRLERAYIDGIPQRRLIYDRLKGLYGKVSGMDVGAKYAGGLLFVLRWAPPKQQYFLVAMRSPDDRGATVVVCDPNELDREGSTSIDFYDPSPDGKLAAVCLSRGGSEDGSVHVFRTDTGAKLADIVPRVNYPTAGGSVAWDHDSSGFYYTRYPNRGERPEEDVNFYQQVYHHVLGADPETDAYEVGKEFPKIAETQLYKSDDGRWLLAEVKNGDGGEVAHHLKGPAGRWVKLTDFQDEAVRASFSSNSESLLLLSRKDAPNGKILLVPLKDEPSLGEARVLVTAREGAIEGFVVTKRRVYMNEMVGGVSKVSAYDAKTGKPVGEVPLEPGSAVVELARFEEDAALIGVTGFLRPRLYLRVDPNALKVHATALASTSPLETDALEVVRDFAVSRDGTKVPISVFRRKGTASDGANPTLLTGYGGYGLNLTPYFTVWQVYWVSKGGIIAYANLRGGGEYGEKWHKEGMLTKKQNVFDDFIACAEHLIRSGVTSRDKLVIEGGSNGGLLMGAAITQRPELFRAAVSRVGLYDMLRVELDPNGQFNTTEYGTVKNPEQFKALYAYSPYHNVREGKPYPPTLLTAGENDGRVNAAHSRKMMAKLQSAADPLKPMLLRTNTSGHGIGTSMDQMIDERADLLAFFADQVGMTLEG